MTQGGQRPALAVRPDPVRKADAQAAGVRVLHRNRAVDPDPEGRGHPAYLIGVGVRPERAPQFARRPAKLVAAEPMSEKPTRLDS